MTKKRIFLTIGCFFLILTVIRIIWILLQNTPDHVQAVKGEVDLRNWEFKDTHVLSLDGQWEFYPSILLLQSDKDKHTIPDDKVFINVPGTWNSTIANDKNPTFGYGSYRLRLLIQPDKDQLFSIRIPPIASSSELYVNGRLLAHSGKPAASEEQYIAGNVPYTVSFATDQSEIEIIIVTANYADRLTGGLFLPVKFGTDLAIDRAVGFSVGTQLAVCLLLLMHVIYILILYWVGARQKVLLSFAMLILCAIITILIDDDRLLPAWSTLNYEWTLKLYYLGYLGLATFLTQYAKGLLPEYASFRGFRWYTYFCGIYFLFALFLPVKTIMLTDALHTLVIVVPFFVLPTLLFRSARRGNEDAIYLLLGSTAITTNMVWGIIKNLGIIELGFYPIDIIACFVAFAAFWFKGYFRTSTQRAILTDQLQKADKLKDDFLLNTSHELRNPLHGMLNIAQTVLNSESRYDEGKNREHMMLLISVGKRMSFLLNDLLDLTMLKESRVRLQLKNLQVQTVAAGALDMLRFMTEGKPILLINNIPDTFPPVIADENRLIQILFNLLHNAVKFTKEGSITIDAQIIDGKAHIQITDTGIGMNLETLRRIFQPYEQGEVDQTESVVGLGLGLNICKQLVELHHGTLTVSSTLDQGSSFTLSLPLSMAPLQEVEPNHTELLSLVHLEAAAASSSITLEPKTALAADRPKILVVDDDPINLSILVSVLTEERYDIVTATSGTEAIALLDTREWDLIISDVMMPQMSGYELSRSIRERFSVSELPILLLTARNRPQDIDAGFLAGANDYVTKPVDTMELQSRVRALTEIKKSIHDRLRMEGAWLQAQIQPHFLFNTLNAIAALSEFDTDRMRTLLVEFGNYLQGSFDFRNSERVIPLKDELDLVRSYLFIEKERFEERLQVTWNIDESLVLSIPPLSIQPLVENAIRHGIMKRTEGGTIHIQIIDYGDYAEVTVADDGIGMDITAHKQLLDKKAGRRSGIGLVNTDRRLKQLYGNGLQIQSTLDQGTTVTFIVKK
ncbi:response regulator [Paenibacillus psychroresistens]|uniref:histidine kinase n=2 Tax=Paenibacillus psychroresistens TaxID=1778678 RepID=A0A6B8RUZ0_9BACL|nr:response regulator [Paenibacillus psychroresistens]